MMRSMYSAVSGLKNHIIRQDVIGNNIANVNTTAYKYSSANFSDILSQTIQGASAATNSRGGINPMQIGLGMGVASISTSFTDGSYQPTGNNANLGIQGQGFFVLSDGNEQIYSRNGNFDFDTNGNYIMNGTGYRVMGWTADGDGNIVNTGAIAPLNFPKGMSIEGKTTTKVDFAYNLSKDAVVGATGMGSITVYDTYGSPHKLTTNFTKVSDGEWLYQAVGDTGTVLPGTQMGIVKFDNNGKVSAINTITPSNTPVISPTSVDFQSFTMDAAVGSTQTSTFSVTDIAGVSHPYTVTFAATTAAPGPSTDWSYQITDASSAVVANGNIHYTGSAYTQTPASPSFMCANGLVNVNFLAGTSGAPGTFGVTPPSTPPAATMDIKFESFQLDNTLNSVQKSYFTVYDINHNMHTYEATVTNTGTNAWNYSVAEAGVTGGPTINGSFSYNTATNAYSLGAGSQTAITLPNAGGTVNLDFLGSAAKIPPDVGAFKLATPATFPTTTALTIGPNMQLDSTAGAVSYKNFTVFDENNSPRVYQMKVTTDSATSWKYEITEPGVPSSKPFTGNISYGGSPATYSISNWTVSPKQTIAFTVGSAVGPAANSFSMNSSPVYAKSASQADIMYVPVNGKPAMNIALNLNDITQFSSGTTNGDSGTTIQALGQNGYAQGTLDSLTIDTSGIIVGKFTNERQQNLGQIALATFNNPNGLMKKGDTIFTKTANSGEAQVGAPGSGSRGKINPGTLEMSNVDLSQEFTNMITTQRGFQANSKIISVDDEMLQDLVNLKR